MRTKWALVKTILRKRSSPEKPRLFTEQTGIPGCDQTEIWMEHTRHAKALRVWEKKLSRPLTELSSRWVHTPQTQ